MINPVYVIKIDNKESDVFRDKYKAMSVYTKFRKTRNVSNPIISLIQINFDNLKNIIDKVPLLKNRIDLSLLKNKNIPDIIKEINLKSK